MAILLIDNYDSFTFNLYQLMRAITDEAVEVFRNDRIDFSSVVEMKPSRVVLSPGPGHPEKDADFGVCRNVILEYDQLSVPVLGVCLGHQGIAHHLGGKVGHAPEIVHGKSSTVTVTADSPLLKGLPVEFEAMRYHSLVVADESFPGCLEVTAREKGGDLIMAMQHRKLPLYGVQFHPESIGTPAGETMMRNFIEAC